MALSATDLPVLSRMLDEALGLEVTEREAWLASVPLDQAHLVEPLRQMLADSLCATTAAGLGALPRLEDEEESGAKAGERVGAYRLLREIGRGGMGSVWLAERADGSFERQVALKLPRLSWMEGLAGRMKRELRIGALLEHPNIARMYDAGVDEHGRPFIAMAYIEGTTIDVYCREKALDIRSRLNLFLQVVRAVGYAHGRLVIHRDLKPANVLVDTTGQTHLVDFGISKRLGESMTEETSLTQAHGRAMTLHYASPEQIAGDAITVQSDVYSLGVLLYELLTRTRPFLAGNGRASALEEAILLGDAPLASRRVANRTTSRALRGDLDAILAKAIARDPARRYDTAHALAQDIDRHLRGDTVSTRPDSMAYRLGKALRRHWVGASASATVLVVIVAGAGLVATEARRATRAAERERVVKEFVSEAFRVDDRADPQDSRPASRQMLIEGGAALIQQRFTGQPELQAELYGVVGNLFSDMGAYRLAADYMKRRAEVLALLQIDRDEQARTTLAWAQALVDDGALIEAKPRVTQVIELVSADSPLGLQAMVLLARVQYELDESTAASATLAQANARLSSVAGVNPSVRPWILFLRARILAFHNRLDEALPIYREAIDAALSGEGASSSTATEIRLQAARALIPTRQTDLAQQYFDAAMTTMRSLGGVHSIRAAYAAGEFAQMRYFSDQGTADEALSRLAASRQTLISSQLPIPDWYVPQMDFWLGKVKYWSGDLAGGIPLMESNAPALLEAADSPWGRYLVISYLGVAMMDAGRHEIAGSLLTQARDLRTQAGVASHPYANIDYVRIVDNLIMQGRPDDARLALDHVPPTEQMRGDGQVRDRWVGLLKLTRARLHLYEGDAPGALAVLEADPPGADEEGYEVLDYRDLLGEAQCASGRSAEGMALLKRQVADWERSGDDARAPWLARLKSVAGWCALETGELPLARMLATQARTAFTAQPGVSPYYKAPLAKLEEALGKV